jgi:hypothetical protein
VPVSTFQQPSPDAELIRCRWWGRITPVGEAARGTAHITYTGPIPMLDDDPTEPTGLYWQDQHIELEIVQRGIRGIMADFGYFEAWLPATNDPDLMGGGYPYRCQVEVSNASVQPKPFTFNVDRSAPSGIVLLNRGEVTTNALFGGAPVQVVSWADHKALQDSVYAMSQRLDSLVTAGGSGGTDLPTTAAIQDVVLATLTGNVRTDAMSRKAEVFTNTAEVEAVVTPALDARVAVNIAQGFTDIEKGIARDNIAAAPAVHAPRHGLGGADQISLHAAQINDGFLGLARATPGTVFRCPWVNTAWTYAGVALTARPSTRTDIFFDYFGAPADTTDPAWGLNGDSRTDAP